MQDETMQDETMPDQSTPAESAPDDAAVSEAPPEADTFGAEYVAKLRAEAAEQRVKGKRLDEANVRLAASYAGATGRLVDVDALPFSESMLGDDGLVDRVRVTEAVAALIAAKPYLASRTPTTPIAQGVLPDVPESPGLFALIRERA